MDYSKYFVCFLDVLGFREYVMNNKQEKIDKYFTTISDLKKSILNIRSKKDIGFIIISDSVILSLPMEDGFENNIRNIRTLCVAIQKIQFELALENIWIRGAISFGDAYFNKDQNQIVGKAYIKSYDLENRVAVFPRVIIDSNLIYELQYEENAAFINYVNNKGSKTGEEYDVEKHNVLFDWYSPRRNNSSNNKLIKDVSLFIDYLAPAFKSMDSFRFIVQNIKENIYKDNVVYLKFKWVLDYLVDSCNYHLQHGLDLDTIELHKEMLRLMKL